VTVWRLLRVGLTVPLLFGGLLWVTAGPAVACSCAIVKSEAERAAHADAVFVGRLVSSRVDPSALAREYRQREEKGIEELKERFGQSVLVVHQADPVVLTFKVSRVYKGAVGKRQEIVIRPGGSDCGGLGVDPRPGPVLVFAYKPAGGSFRLEPGQYVSGGCSGSRLLADGGAPALGGPWAGEPGWPDSLVGVGVLVAGVAAGLGLAAFRARRRASAG
jgi:hypothetical protein